MKYLSPGIDARILRRRQAVGNTVVLLLILMPGLLLGSASRSLADDDEDWRQLREEVQSGRIKPLSEILDALLRDWSGKVIDVDLEGDDGRRIYEIELLGDEGQVVEFEIDAVTGELIGIEGKNINMMRRP